MTDVPSSLIAFQQRFPDEAACAPYLAAVRWPHGFVCPRCLHTKAWLLQTKTQTYECASCHKQTSVTAGTILHASKLQLTVWFWAAYLMATHSNSISALQLRQSDRLGLLQDGLVALRQAARQRGALAYYVRNMVLDVRLPGLSGLDFQQELAREDIPIPIIFITGHGDIPMSVRAMKAGAVEFLTKLLRDQDLLDAIHAALRRDRSRLEEERKAADLRRRHESLRLASQVIALLVAGRVIKQIAAEIGISEVTVRLHRGQIMRKMRAGSLADLGASRRQDQNLTGASALDARSPLRRPSSLKRT